MKRLVLALLTVFGLVGVFVVAPVAAGPAPVFTGDVVDVYTGKPLAGAKVTAYNTKGVAVGTVTANFAGEFAFAAPGGQATLGFAITAVTSHQPGPRTCDFDTAWAGGTLCQFDNSQPIHITALPDYGSGTIIDTITRLPVSGVTVTALDVDGVTVFGTGVTDVNGHFLVHGVVGDEMGIYVNGAAVGHRSGFYDCGTAVIVATWPEACTFAPGHRVDRVLAPLLTAPRSTSYRSLVAHTVIASFLRPSAGQPISYEVRCVGPDRVARVTKILASGAKVGGLPTGRNTCQVRGVSKFGPGPYSMVLAVTVR
jgi:hypothetical protein